MPFGLIESGVVYANLGLKTTALSATNFTAAVNSAAGLRAYANAAVSTAQAAMSESDFATAVLSNLGVTAATIGAPAYAALQPAIAAYLNSVGKANYGVVAIQLAQALSVLTADATYGAAAKQLNNAAASAYTWGTTAANTTDKVINVATEAAPVTPFTLTTATDVPALTSGNDTITGTTATTGADGDAIVDVSTTDNDTLNLTLTAALGNTDFTKVSGIENVNVTWNAFGTATVDAEDITGATITGTSSKVGFLGSFTVSNAKANKLVAGSGMTGTMTVTGATTSTVNAGSSKTVSITSAGSTAADTLSLTANSATSVTVADFNTATVNAAAATTISLTDDDNAADDGDTATLNFGKTATLTNAVDDLTVNATAAGLTLTVSAVGESMDVAGTQNLTLNIDDATDFTGEKVTKSSTGTVTLNIEDIDGPSDLDAVVVDLIKVKAATVGGALTVKSGQKVQVLDDLASAYGLTVAGTGTSDTATLVLDDSQASIITFTGIETATIAANAEVSSTAVDLTIAEINAGTKKVVLTGANDVTITLAEAATLDASALTNRLVVTQDAAAAMDILGGTSENTVVFKGTTHDNNYVGQDAKDTVTLANTTGNATASVGNGVNTVTANAVTTGTLVVNGGSGVDTVSATALTTGTVVLTLGDGANVVTLDGVFNSVNLTVETGAGNDSVTIADATVAGDKVTLSLGDGTDTLTISEDMTAGTWSVTGLEKIAIGSSDTAAIVNATLLTGKTYTITGDGTATDHLAVEFDAAGTGDFSGIVIDNTLTKGLAGLTITGTSGNQIIVGTSGADVIDGNDGTDFITGGVGVDAITAGTGVDTFVFAAGDSGTTTATADAITDFTSATDKLDFNIAAGTAANYAEVLVDVADMATGKTAADNAMNGTVIYYFTDDGTDGYLFVDTNADGTADLGLKLMGVVDMALGDIIA